MTHYFYVVLLINGYTLLQLFLKEIEKKQLSERYITTDFRSIFLWWLTSTVYILIGSFDIFWSQSLLLIIFLYKIRLFDEAWIGTHYNNGKWIWILASSYKIKVTGKAGCAYMYTDVNAQDKIFWRFSNCIEKRMFICKKRLGK